jgi:hypothetical protein
VFLYHEKGLLSVLVDIDLGDFVDPLIKKVLLILCKVAGEGVSEDLEVSTLRVVLPLDTEDLLDPFDIDLKFPFNLSGPGNFV